MSAADPDAITVVIERRDRFDVAELLLNEAKRLEAEARLRRRNALPRTRLFDQAARFHVLSVRIRP